MAREHHPQHSPSSFPPRMQCAEFDALAGDMEDEVDDASKGEQLHAAAEAFFLHRPVPATPDLEQVDIEDAEETVDRAWGVILDHMPAGSFTTHTETRISIKDVDGNEVSFGWADALVIGKDLLAVVDWKSSWGGAWWLKNYRAQTLAYALGAMQESGLRKVLCIEGHMKPRKLKHYLADYGECASTVEYAIRRRLDPNRVPMINIYCRWCRNFLRCKAVNRWLDRVDVGTALRPEVLLNPEAVQDPRELGMALTVAADALGRAAIHIGSLQERLKKKAFELIDNGAVIPGWRAGSREGRKIVGSVSAALKALDLELEQADAALSVSLPKLSSAYAKDNGLKVREARSKVEGLLFENMSSGKASRTLERVDE